MRYGNVHCQSCSIKCKILPAQEFRASQCLNSMVCIWPEVNSFFCVGIESVINSIRVITSLSGFVFVDFSWRNIDFFIDDGWGEYLASTGMRVVLLSDKRMAPLATYYKQNEGSISDVIYLSEGGDSLLINFGKIFIGLPLFHRVGKTLTKKEKDVLYLTLKQKKVTEIVDEMSLDAKSVYNIRQRIESKIGMKIRNLS